MKLLENKVAIVTGAGLLRGIGRACALKLAKSGAHVVVTDLIRNPSGPEAESLQELVQEIEALDVMALGLPVDVTIREQIQICIDQTLTKFGKIDILVNNAGTPIGAAPFLEVPPAHWNQSWQINVMGMVNFCQLVIPVMQKQGGGAIINNASLAGLGAVPKFGAYIATKHAAVGLAKTLAAEFAEDNIRVNAVCPGMVATSMGDEEVALVAKNESISIKEAQDLLSASVPLKRWAMPEEVGDAVTYLAGPTASYLTGVTLEVAGGLAKGL